MTKSGVINQFAQFQDESKVTGFKSTNCYPNAGFYVVSNDLSQNLLNINVSTQNLGYYKITEMLFCFIMTSKASHSSVSLFKNEFEPITSCLRSMGSPTLDQQVIQ